MTISIFLCNMYTRKWHGEAKQRLQCPFNQEAAGEKRQRPARDWERWKRKYSPHLRSCVGMAPL